ncbi:MAG: arsenosugar biosynthesis radical SAM (seleno)protein ArsS [Nitrospirota bacterium]
MIGFDKKVLETQTVPLGANGIRILQLNVCYKCNMACKHCHLEAGPGKNEFMSKDIIDISLEVLRNCPIEALDITGGAPELNPHYAYLVEEARRSGRRVITRTNLTIFFEEGMKNLPEMFADNEVEVVASLPHYTEGGVDRVRGAGAFRKSIEALKRLNTLGYGLEEKRQLHLVYNPLGAFLPSSQRELEAQYKKELASYGIVFNRLFTFANMPLGRFRDFLIRTGNLQKYMDSLRTAFNPCTLNGLMCRYLVSVGWDGTLYDCDFNQMLGLTVDIKCPDHIRDFDYSVLSNRKIITDDHCYVCTAGQGST